MSGFRRPPWWAIVLTIAAAALFVRLGFWQLHRADYKIALLHRYAAAAVAAPQPFAVVAADPPEDAYPRVRVQGNLQTDRMYLVDNPKHDNRGGVEVYVPLQVPGHARLLLVDMGFLPGNGTDQTPHIPALSAAAQTLQGLYTPPVGHGFEMGGDALARETRWPKKTIYLDMKQVANDLHAALFPRVLELDADPASGFVRVHKLDFGNMPPARHRAYAFQWFSFAFAVVAILLVLNRKRGPRKP